MKALTVILALAVGIGCLAAAAWMGNQAATKPPTDSAAGTTSASTPPAVEAGAPEISKEGPHPKAVIESTEHDFGVMQHESKGAHVFTIRNEGEAPLQLVALAKDRTCQCTEASLSSSDPVPPGGEVTVELHWHIKAENPNFRHSAKVRTNDPDHQVIELAVLGKVEKSFQFDPAGSLWDLGDVSGEKTMTSTKMMYSAAMDFEITQVGLSNPRLKCGWEPMDAAALGERQARCGYVLKLEADLHDFTGLLDERLEIETSAGDKKGVVNVKARRLGPIEMMDRKWDSENNRLILGEFPAHEGKQHTISVYTRVEEPVNLLSAESEHQAVKVSWEPDEKFQGKSLTRRYRLKVEVPPGPAAQRQRIRAEKVELKFDHPQIGTMKILVDYLSI